MSYLGEAWLLFKKTWWPLLRLGLVTLALAAPLYIVFVIATVLLRAHWLIALITGLALFLAWTVLMSALAFAYASLISWSYFGEQPRVWRLVRQGFAYWGRMVLLGLCNILFALPVVAPMVIIGTVATLRLGSQPEWLGWVNLALYPFTAVLGTYSIFALLNAVRLDMRAWRSWITGWMLIPRNAWLRTVGLLTGLKFLFAIAGQLVSAPLRANPTSNLNTILVFALMWLITTVVSLYFAFYAVAIWRRYTRLPEAAPIPEALRADLAHPLIDELDDPVTGKTDKDAGENG